jgi:hypothetical protein
MIAAFTEFLLEYVITTFPSCIATFNNMCMQHSNM